ncbi:MAG: hypothetical protein ACXWUG_04985 [Polyangiales bacterium]
MRASLSLFAVSFLALSSVACAGKNAGPDTAGLDSDSAALVSDNSEVDETEGSVESGLEEPLSGAIEGGEVDVTATDPVTVAESARTNPGIFFKPAGCIVSTRSGNVVTHVFTNCTGPYGLTSFNGTVTSTWSKIAGGFQVVHVAKGFQINGATVDHTATIAYTKADGVYTRTRKGSLTGTTAKGRAITHSADYVTTWDPTAKCITRNGSSDTTIGLREFSRSITGYERCGVGYLGCPKSGTVELKRPRIDVKLSFPGGPAVDIEVNGHDFHRDLVCNAS